MWADRVSGHVQEEAVAMILTVGDFPSCAEVDVVAKEPARIITNSHFEVLLQLSCHLWQVDFAVDWAIQRLVHENGLI